MSRLIQVIGFEGPPAAVDAISWGGAAFVHDGCVENVAGMRSRQDNPSTQRTLAKYVRLLPVPVDVEVEATNQIRGLEANGDARRYINLGPQGPAPWRALSSLVEADDYLAFHRAQDSDFLVTITHEAFEAICERAVRLLLTDFRVTVDPVRRRHLSALALTLSAHHPTSNAMFVASTTRHRSSAWVIARASVGHHRPADYESFLALTAELGAVVPVDEEGP